MYICIKLKQCLQINKVVWFYYKFLVAVLLNLTLVITVYIILNLSKYHGLCNLYFNNIL